MERGSYQIANNEARSPQERYNYWTTLGSKPIQLAMAPPVQQLSTAPVTPKGDTAPHVTQPPQQSASRNSYASAQGNRRDHA